MGDPVPVYRDGLVTLWLADSIRHAYLWCDVEGTVMVADPPYGVAWRQGDLKGHKATRSGIAGDADTAVRDAALAAHGGPAIVFASPLKPPPGARQGLVYLKPRGAGFRGALGGFRRDVEMVYLVGKWPSGLGGRSSVLSTAAPMVSGRGGLSRRGGHPHAKPTDLLRDLISATPEGAVIVDPFAGGGSVLLAAAQLGRRAVGVEVDPAFAYRAALRLHKASEAGYRPEGWY